VEAMRRSSRLTPVGGSLAFLVLGFAAVYARKASMAAIEASRLKSEFLASMSHEIRTPLNGVVGMLQMLDTPSLAAEQQEQVRVALRSSDALMRLLNDILDLSKIESGKMELESLAFSPREAAAEVHALLRARAAEKNLQFDLAVSPDLPAAVRGDAARLKQVLLNLCGNAIKFTCIGRVTLTVTSRLGLTGPATLVFAVEDTGTGIAPEAQRKLFRAFEQGSLGIARNFGGSGLGLAISQRLIKQMNGEIRLVSTLGQGSCFSFDLTLPLADSLLPVPMERVAPAALESSFRILVAEDDGVSRLVIKALLGKAGLACTTVPDGLAAVEAVRQGTWDLVLMDVQMPGLDGLEATRQMRASGAIVPIVALTANVMPQDRVQCDQAGMDGFLGKPVREEELRACLRRWLPPLQAPASSPPVRHAGSASRPRERSRT
jgi:two-component system, sensor histidine kinase